VGGQIILPERYKEVEAADLANEEDMDAEDDDVEEDEETSKKTVTPEDDE
jgi:hypothetical protein